MASLQWIGGGNNQASNPHDWIDTSTDLPPALPPQPGDSLTVQGTPGEQTPFTMNVSDNDLAGNRVFSNDTDLTANLSRDANMSIQLVFSNGTFNLAQHSALDLLLGLSNATVNMSSNDIAHVDTSNHGGAVINMSGSDTATLIGGMHGGLIVNLDQGARWSGTFEQGSIVVNGGANSAFNNNGNSTTANVGATIGVDVVGSGSFTASSRLEFMKSVGPNQSISDGGLVQIDQPKQFAASITLGSLPSGILPPEIDLMGLAKADGYTYKNDMLNILSGNKIIDTLRLHDSTLNGFVVEPPTAAGSVNIVAIADPLHPPPSLPNLTGVV